MKLGDKVKEVVESGITPIALHFEPVHFFDNAPPIMRSFVVLNSLDLGTLTYRQYRFVARRTKQGDHLVERHLIKLMRAIPPMLEEECNIACFTVPVYARLLRDGVLAKMLFDTFALYPHVSPELVCIELSADILYEDMAEAKLRIDELRALGVKVAICEVGDEFCPVFRLATLAFDYAFLDAYATESLAGEGAARVAGSLVSYLHYLNVKVIAPALDTKEKISGAHSVACDGYTADTLVGGEVAEA